MLGLFPDLSRVFYGRTNKAKLTINQLNSFEEVKDFLASQIDQQENETANGCTNIDSIIDKQKGS